LKKLNTGNLIILLCGFLLFVLVAVSIFSGTKGRASRAGLVVEVERRDFTIRIVENGVLEALNSITLGSKIKSNDARIIEMVPEGQQVNAGDTIMRFDPTPFEDKIREYKAALVEAEARWGEARDNLKMEEINYEKQLATAELKLELAEYARRNVMEGEGKLELIEKEMEAKKLKAKLDAIQAYIDDSQKELENEVEAHLIENLRLQIRKKKQELEEARGEWEIAQKKYDTYKDFIYPEKQAKAKAEQAAAELELGQVQGSREALFATWNSKVNSAEAVLNKARSNLETAEKQLKNAVIYAPTDGFVIYNEVYVSGEKRKVRIGDAIWVNQPIITLPDISRMRVRTRIREIDIHLVEKGQAVKAYCNAFPDMELKGKVEQIGALAEKVQERRSYEKYFDLQVLLDDTNQKLRPGMTARVEIEVANIPDAVVIPSSAVFVEDGQTYVYLANGKKRPIRLGPGDGNFVVVERGLEKGWKLSLVKPEQK